MDPEFDALKREFLGEALAKVNEIERTLAGGGDAVRDRVTYLAHQLKGSGGSYGFQRISIEAAEIEKIAERAADGWSADGALSERIAALREEIAAREQELS